MTFDLTLVEAYLRDRVAPLANKLDSCHKTLQQAFGDLGQQNWLGLKIPVEWAGSGLSAPKFQTFQELLARFSGALAFLQAQHQSAGGFLARSDNDRLKQEYLPEMGRGTIAVGVGFSHLRHITPQLKAVPVPGGY